MAYLRYYTNKTLQSQGKTPWFPHKDVFFKSSFIHIIWHLYYQGFIKFFHNFHKFVENNVNKCEIM